MSLLYDQIKALEEAHFPLPTTHAKANVGTFNALDGTFRFDPKVRIRTETIADPRPHSLTFHILPVDAVNVGLEFTVINRQRNFDISLFDGSTISAPPNQNTITIEVGKDIVADFAITSGNQSFSSDLTIDRPPIIGAGAFRIPALPIAFVYAPLQGSLQRNSVNYNFISSVGIRTKLSFSDDQSSTNADFNAFEALRQKASDAVNAAQIAGENHPYARAVAIGLTLLGNLLGSVDTTTVTGFTITNEHDFGVIDTREYRNGSEAGKGPGVGDRCIILKGVEVIWLAVNGNVTLSVLSTPERDAFSVRQLQQDLQGPSPGVITGLDHDTLRALLLLDPFVVLGPIVVGPIRLPSPRFIAVEQPATFEGGGTGPDGDVIAFSHTVTTTDMRTKVSYEMITVEHRPGWLSLLHIGEDQSGSQRTSFTSSSSTEISQGQTVTVTVTFFTQGDELYKVKGFYDRLFGTMVFVNPNQLVNPITL